MERIIECSDDVVDLGVASLETQGEPNTMPEFSLEQPKAGVSQD